MAMINERRIRLRVALTVRHRPTERSTHLPQHVNNPIPIVQALTAIALPTHLMVQYVVFQFQQDNMLTCI